MIPDCSACSEKHNCPDYIIPGSLMCAMFRAHFIGPSADPILNIMPDTESLSCDGCRYETKQVNETPCCNCIRCPKADHYAPEDDWED